MMKRNVFHFLLIVVYLIASQFVVKAWVTTDWELTASESFCMNKKLDTYEGKRGCWKKNMSASFVADIEEVSIQTKILTDISNTSIPTDMFSHILVMPKQHRPPGDSNNEGYTFVNDYVGVTVLII